MMKILNSDLKLHSDNISVNFLYEKVKISFFSKSNDTDKEEIVSINSRIKRLDIKNISLEDEIDEHSLKVLIIKLLLEKLTGEKVHITSLKDIENPNLTPPDTNPPEFASELKYEKIKYSKQEVNFRAYGFVKTKDGRQIRFDISFRLNKEQLEKIELDIKAGSLALIDPLIINIDGNLENILSDTYFEFDIDNDGVKENIPELTAGNGFLVFDKNGNGTIDNGSELFGTITGDGFRELSKFDDDKNGWIDENDEIFKKLGIWIKNENQDRIYPLKEFSIGAIYLRGIPTSFQYQNGVLRNSSIYITEDLNPGIISKVDLLI